MNSWSQILTSPMFLQVASELPLIGVYLRLLSPLSISCLFLLLTLSCDLSYCPNGDKKAGLARCLPRAVQGTHASPLTLPFHHSEEIAVPSSSSRWLPFCLPRPRTPPTFLLPPEPIPFLSPLLFSLLLTSRSVSHLTWVHNLKHHLYSIP